MKRLLGSLFLVAALVALPQKANAAQLTFTYDVQFSNTTLPGGTGPWLRVTLDDEAAGPGVVRMTLDVLDLTDTEFVSKWFFNLNPDIDPDELSFGFVDTADALPGLTLGTNCCNADGGGRYDIRLDFDTREGAGRFTDGESIVLDVSWTLGPLVVADFNFLASRNGGHGPFLTAAHIQGIVGGDGSTFVAPMAAPEPGSLLLLGAGLSLAARRLRRTK